MLNTTPDIVSLGETPTAEVTEVHELVASYIYGQEGDSLAKLTENNSKWRAAAVKAALLHLDQHTSTVLGV